MYELIVREDGYIDFLLQTGNDFVKNKMPETTARAMMSNRTVENSHRDDYPLIVGGEFYFPARIKKTTSKRKEK